MAGREGPHRAIIDAVDGDLIPLGRYATRGNGDGYTVTIPMTAVNALDVDRDTEWAVSLDFDREALVLMKADE